VWKRLARRFWNSDGAPTAACGKDLVMAEFLKIAPYIATPIALVTVIVMVMGWLGQQRAETLRAAVGLADPSDLPAILQDAPAWIRDVAKTIPKKDLKELLIHEMETRASAQATRLRYVVGAGVATVALAVAAFIAQPSQSPAPSWTIHSATPTRAGAGWSLGVRFSADGVRGGVLALEVTQGADWDGQNSVRVNALRSGDGLSLLVGLDAPGFSAGVGQARLVVMDGAKRVHVSPPSSFKLAS
jgi:hypothetical protein